MVVPKGGRSFRFREFMVKWKNKSYWKCSWVSELRVRGMVSTHALAWGLWSIVCDYLYPIVAALLSVHVQLVALFFLCLSSWTCTNSTFCAVTCDATTWTIPRPRVPHTSTRGFAREAQVLSMRTRWTGLRRPC